MTKHPKRPRDPNQLGKLIADLATGGRTEDQVMTRKAVDEKWSRAEFALPSTEADRIESGE